MTDVRVTLWGGGLSPTVDAFELLARLREVSDDEESPRLLDELVNELEEDLS